MSDCILECSGIGAQAFLQGQLTCNINDLKPNQAQLTACCNLQGRVIFTAFVIMKNTQDFLLIIPKTMGNIVFSHLEKYAKFSKCALKHIESAEITNGSPFSHQQNIFHGVPTIYPETSEQFIAQRLNLHLIDGAISFKKGCYLGQEVISRLHFKGKLKHHMYLGSVPAVNVLAINGKIINDAHEVTGTIVNYRTDEDNILLLFINTIENKVPSLESGQKITLLSLPYSFRDEAL